MATDNVSREPAAILTAIESFLVAPPINVSGSVHQPTDTDTDTDVTALLPLAFVYDGTLVQDRIAPHLVTYLAKGVDIASELGPGSTASTIFQAGLRTAGLLTTAQGYNDLDGNRGGQWCDHGPMQHPEEDDDNDHNDDDDDDISNDDDSDDDSSYISSNGAVEGEPGLSDALSNLLFRPLENLTQSPMPRNRNIAHRKVKLCALGSAGRPDWYIQIKNRRRVLIELMTEWVARREYFDGIVAMVATGQVTWHPASREVVYAGSEMHNLGVWAVVRLLLKQVGRVWSRQRRISVSALTSTRCTASSRRIARPRGSSSRRTSTASSFTATTLLSTHRMWSKGTARAPQRSRARVPPRYCWGCGSCPRENMYPRKWRIRADRAGWRVGWAVRTDHQRFRDSEGSRCRDRDSVATTLVTEVDLTQGTWPAEQSRLRSVANEVKTAARHPPWGPIPPCPRPFATAQHPSCCTATARQSPT